MVVESCSLPGELGLGAARERVLKSFLLVFLFATVLLRAGEKPLKVEEGWKNINGTDLYYKTIGEGTPIVIIHGGPGLDHTYLLPQFLELAKHHRLIFFDQRASGKSSSIVDTGSITMSNFVEDVEGIRKAFKLGKMNLLGHSWGGLVAMFYAVKYPGNLNCLMLVNSTPGSAALRDASFAVMAQRTSREDNLAQAALTQTEGFRKRSPEAMARFFRLLFRGSFFDRRYADSLTLTIDTSYVTKSRLIQYLFKDRELASYDLHSRLNGIHCPTLILGAKYDMVGPEANEKIHRNIEGSLLLVLDSCGHFPYIESPREFFSALEGFLAKAR